MNRSAPPHLNFKPRVHPSALHHSFCVTTTLWSKNFFFLFSGWWVGTHPRSLSYKSGSDMETPSHRTSLLRSKDEQSAIQPEHETNGGELKSLLVQSDSPKRILLQKHFSLFILLRYPLTQGLTFASDRNPK